VLEKSKDNDAIAKQHERDSIRREIHAQMQAQANEYVQAQIESERQRLQ